jgi:hypothetical protein
MANDVEYIEVEKRADLARDVHSDAIINRDKKAYDIAIKRAKSAQEQRDEIRDTTREINTLKCEIHEIKGLLTELIGKQ